MANVLLLFGGKSAEHEISCVSAVAVAEALRNGGHKVIPIGIGKDGSWWLADAEQDPFEARGKTAVLQLPHGRLEADGDMYDFDVVFPVLHGPFGEDGTIQGVFEIAGIPYVGCHVKSSAVAMDKDFTKQIAARAGIPVIPWRVVRRPDFDDPGSVVDDIVGDFGLPVFVKPAELGSSVGISKCETEAALKEGVHAALAFGDKVVVETAMTGREIEVAVLDGRASLAGEVVVERGWYDYDAKYADETSEFVAPAELTSSQMADVRMLAERTFETLGCKGLARVDFFLTENGFFLNEVNTMPGFTPISGFPKMWIATGMTYPELCGALVDLALEQPLP